MVGTRVFSIVLAAAFALLTACTPATEVAAERTVRAVRTTVAETSAAQRARTFSGTSQSSQQSRLSFKVSGTLEALPIEVGDTLEAGQLIARIDAAQYQLQAQQFEATLVQTEAALRNAASNYERVKGLYENSNASRSDLDAARANAESAQAQVDAARKQLELARLNVADTSLRASKACSVASIDVEVNENISAGATVAMVNCGSTLEVDLSIPENLIGGIARGMAAEVAFDAIPDVDPFTGEVTEVGVTALDGATFPVTVTIRGTHPDLRAGLAANVLFRFTRPGRGDLVLLPLSAVARDGASSYVFLAESTTGDQARVVRRPVTLGELTEDGVEVLEGVVAGERVITAGVSVIRDGLTVRLAPDAAAPADAG
ncbi:MAG: efflux RND transporter periplasmic adaptor subunit [Acidobacteriota bacterium]